MVAGPQADVVIAPGYGDGAIEALRAKRKNTRLLEAAPPEPPTAHFRQITGGFLVQDAHHFAAGRDDWRVVTKRAPTDAEWGDAELAWRICGHVKSNAIVLVKDGLAVGIGAGQQNRVESGEIAAKKAAGRAEGGACASDAFYPFPDGIEAAADGRRRGRHPARRLGAATRPSSPRPTSSASPWCSPANGTSSIEGSPASAAKLMPGGPVADAVFADLVPRSEKLDRQRAHAGPRHHPRRRRRRQRALRRHEDGEGRGARVVGAARAPARGRHARPT